MVNATTYVNGIIMLSILFGVGYATRPSIRICLRRWIKMNDANYKKAIQKYMDCSSLLTRISNPEKRIYKRFLIRNLDESTQYFFKRTSLPAEDIVPIVTKISRLIDSLDEEKKEKREIQGTKQSYLLAGFIFLIVCQFVLVALLLQRICFTKEISVEIDKPKYGESCIHAQQQGLEKSNSSSSSYIGSSSELEAIIKRSVHPKKKKSKIRTRIKSFIKY